MKRRRWACSSLVALLIACLAGAASAAPVEPSQAQLIVAADLDPPPASDPRWREVPLSDARQVEVAWYRVSFDAPSLEGFWHVYLPYLNGGGRLWLNGEPVATVTENSPELRVRWERPLLLPLPARALRAQGNELWLRVAPAHTSTEVRMPGLVLGPHAALQPMFDRRLFFVRTMPLVTVITGVVVGVLVLLIWWRRRQETVYGLFGLGALFWALRTTTFIFDTLPASWWDVWRLVYFACTGGFIIVMALFTLALAGWSRLLITRALFGYWALGPLLFLIGGEMLVSRWWIAGLMPVGLGLAVVAFAAAWRQRSAATVSIAAAVAVAVLAGVHDYMVAWNSPWLAALLPHWSDHRLFLLHHAANLLLIVMGALLAARFVRTLGDVEAANDTLEGRVRDREREIAGNYERIATLQREQAATDERQRIMRDLHDGLGSQLFTSLSRAERGSLDSAAMSDTLRSAIDQMRIAIEALASDEQDFRTTFGNFRFRWDPRLREGGLEPTWQLDLPDEVLDIAPHDALQILHIAQEALTNVLKHARAQTVSVRLQRDGDALILEVSDDGAGAPGATVADSRGRGQANMRVRAQRLGGALDVSFGPQGARVRLRMPLSR